MSQLDSDSIKPLNEKPHHQVDLFSVLELTKDATAEQIKTKYNALILIHHPDKGGDAKKFRDIKIAYKILSDPLKKAIYVKSLSASFSEISQDYKDNQTGRAIDLGYLSHEEDFGYKQGTSTTEQEREQKKEAFMQKFENNRDEKEKNMIEEAQIKAISKPNSLDELKKLRESDDLQIPYQPVDSKIWQNDPNIFNSFFNQAFESHKKSNATDLTTYEEPMALGQTSLAPLDHNVHHSSLFNSDPWQNYQQQHDFLTYQAPTNLDFSKVNQQIDITRTADQNPENLNDLLNQRMQAHLKNRNELLDLDPNQYQIKDEHHPSKHPLSHLNMLGNEPICQTIDPPKELKK